MINRILISRVVEEFMAALSAKRLDKNVIDDYEFILSELIRGFYENFPPLLEEITTEDIALYFNYLQGCQFKYDPYRQYRRPPTLELARFEQAKRELSTFWKWTAENYTVTNPYIPKTLADDSKRIPLVSVEEIRRLVQLIEAHNPHISDRASISEKNYLRDNALVLLLIDTGIRAEDLSWLTVKDVRFDYRAITIDNIYGNRRNIPIGAKLYKLLDRYISRYFHEKDQADALLIPGDHSGSPIDRNAVQKFLGKIGKKAGIDNLYALRLRALFAYYYAQECMDEEKVRQYLGLQSRKHLRLYIDEIEGKASSPSKHISIMDKWDI